RVPPGAPAARATKGRDRPPRLHHHATFLADLLQELVDRFHERFGRRAHLALFRFHQRHETHGFSPSRIRFSSTALEVAGRVRTHLSYPTPISLKRSIASLSPKSSSSNSWRTSISPSFPSIDGLGKRRVHSIASSRDFT